MKGYTRGIAARPLAILVAASAALALAGCTPTDTEDDGISIVASTDIYGDIAAAIAGDRATVTSIISGPAIDPHSYEATARDQLALSRADIVVENGGGFDPFIHTLLEAIDGEPIVITATVASGLAAEGEHHDHGDHDHEHDNDHDHGHDDHSHHHDGNEHVWYSLDAAHAVADEIAHHLTDLDPDGADHYESNLDGFITELSDLTERVDGIRDRHEGTSVAITEPAPALLLSDMGLVNETPPEFSRAVEEGSDVAPTVLLATRALIEQRQVALLAYNTQTSGRETEQLVALAEEVGIPVVTIAETLPADETYLSWMGATIDEIAAALD